jgi:thiol:disulfide interchange protein DsbD
MGAMKHRRPTPYPTAFRAAALLLMLLAGFAGIAAATPWWMRGAQSNNTDFLPPEVAFRVAAHIDGGVLKIRWLIADGYYLYRSKMEVRAESPDLVLSAAQFPAGTTKSDPYLGTQAVFLQDVEATVPFVRADFGAHPMQIKVTYQGCAQAGLCYPPITRVLFPDSPPQIDQAVPHPWEGIAIVAGCLAFLAAGLLLRKGRRLDLPGL